MFSKAQKVKQDLKSISFKQVAEVGHDGRRLCLSSGHDARS
jgi:hypothetical protein